MEVSFIKAGHLFTRDNKFQKSKYVLVKYMENLLKEADVSVQQATIHKKGRTTLNSITKVTAVKL